MWWRVLVVAVLVGTAGCTTLTGSEEAETLTPAPVPSDVPEGGPESMPAPGLYPDGEIDLTWLVDAHQDALANQSFAWRATRNWTGQVGNVSSDVDSFHVIAVESPTRYVRDTDQAIGHLSQSIYSRFSEYGNGSYRFVRADEFTSAGTEYARMPVSNASYRLIQQTTVPIFQYLNVDAATLEAVQVDGETRYRVEGHTIPDTVGATVSNYTVTADVTPDGLVWNLSTQYTLTNGDSVERIEYAFQFEQIGNVTVDEPSWVAEARANVSAG